MVRETHAFKKLPRVCRVVPFLSCDRKCRTKKPVPFPWPDVRLRSPLHRTFRMASSMWPSIRKKTSRDMTIKMTCNNANSMSIVWCGGHIYGEGCGSGPADLFGMSKEGRPLYGIVYRTGVLIGSALAPAKIIYCSVIFSRPLGVCEESGKV